MVTPVAVEVPRLRAPEIASNSGEITDVLTWPVPVTRKLAVWSTEFWFWM
jgi:hypothetical protein